jgi:hypothetical protein
MCSRVHGCTKRRQKSHKEQLVRVRRERRGEEISTCVSGVTIRSYTRAVVAWWCLWKMGACVQEWARRGQNAGQSVRQCKPLPRPMDCLNTDVLALERHRACHPEEDVGVELTRSGFVHGCVVSARVMCG